MDTVYFLQRNLPKIMERCLEETFEFYHPDVLPIKEAVEKFGTKFEEYFNPDTYEYTVTDETLAEFMNELGELLFERIMGESVKLNQVEMLHDGTDFVFRLIEK